jgi:DNA transformation protein
VNKPGNDTFKDFILDPLRGLGSISCKPMFGGYGLYQGARFFGILYKGRLYFKVSEAGKRTNIEAGMEPFTPYKSQTLTSFYEVPPDVVESLPQMTDWARDAIKAATVKGTKRPVARPSMRPGHTSRPGDPKHLSCTPAGAGSPRPPRRG